MNIWLIRMNFAYILMSLSLLPLHGVVEDGGTLGHLLFFLGCLLKGTSRLAFHHALDGRHFDLFLGDIFIIRVLKFILLGNTGLHRHQLFLTHFLSIKLTQLWQHLNHAHPIVWLHSDRVILQRKDSQLRELLQITKFIQRSDLILPQIQLTQPHAILNIFKRRNVIDSETEDLQPRHLLNDRDFVEVVAPKI